MNVEYRNVPNKEELFRRNEFKLHDGDNVARYSLQPVAGDYPIYSRVIYDLSNFPSMDTLLFLPITEKEFSEESKSINQKYYYGYAITFAISIEPLIQMVGKETPSDLFKLEMACRARRIVYHIKDEEIYVDEERDPLYPATALTQQYRRDSIYEGALTTLSNSIIRHCEVYSTNGNL